MQRAHSYPAPGRRTPGPPLVWRAKAGAALDTEPLPKQMHVIARTLRIREVFLTEFRGRATLPALGDRCHDLGLLDGLSTHESAAESLRAALRPIATTSPHWPTLRPASPPS